MKDSHRSCLGFIFILLALGLGIGAAVGGWMGADFRAGIILGIGTFIFFCVIAGYFFLQIKDWSWIPAIASGIYLLLPDLILGPEDDFLIMLLGGLISVFLAWRKNKIVNSTNSNEL